MRIKWYIGLAFVGALILAGVGFAEYRARAFVTAAVINRYEARLQFTPNVTKTERISLFPSIFQVTFVYDDHDYAVVVPRDGWPTELPIPDAIYEKNFGKK